MTNEALLGWVALLQVLGLFVIKLWLENSMKFKFRKREQAALVAALFAEWIDKSMQKKELNRLAWEAALWLPDDLATEVNKRLANQPDAVDLREILLKNKGLIHHRKSKMKWADIVYYQ
jgi:hypothetical protein